ncbi:hypothetical protein ACFLWA_05450 [Chloroflexota bacterium]
MNSTPDLMQTDPALELANGGRTSCASVSITNSLGWLADNGFADLTLMDPAGERTHTATAQALDRHFGIPHSGGILPPRLVSELSRFLLARGYQPTDFCLEYQGWLVSNGDAQAPSIDVVKRGIIGTSAVWLLVGFYRYDNDTDEYVLLSHHYVTLVGYGLDGSGSADPSILIIHDPAPRSGEGISHDHVRLEPIDSGTLMVDPGSRLEPHYPQLPVAAAGYYKLAGELAYNPEADVAILDAAVILRMDASQGSALPN